MSGVRFAKSLVKADCRQLEDGTLLHHCRHAQSVYSPLAGITLRIRELLMWQTALVSTRCQALLRQLTFAEAQTPAVPLESCSVHSSLETAVEAAYLAQAQSRTRASMICLRCGLCHVVNDRSDVSVGSSPYPKGVWLAPGCSRATNSDHPQRTV